MLTGEHAGQRGLLYTGSQASAGQANHKSPNVMTWLPRVTLALGDFFHPDLLLHVNTSGHPLELGDDHDDKANMHKL